MAKSEYKDNVIQLNKNVDEQHLINAEESIKRAKDIRIEFIAEIVDMIMEQSISTIQNYGALTDPKRYPVLDIKAMEIAVESALCRYYGIDHEYHMVVDNLFSIKEDDDEDEENSI